MNRTWLRAIRTTLAVVVLAALIWLADPLELWASLSHITWGLLLLLLLLSVILIYISAIKWQYFLQYQQAQVGALHLFNLYVVGYFINLLVPSYIGGDAVRSWYAGKKVGQHLAFAATILERYTGFVAMLLLALLFVWGAAGVTSEIRLVVVGLSLALAVITVAALSQRVLGCLGDKGRLGRVAKHLAQVQQVFLTVKGRPVLLIKALALSFLFHSFTVLNTIAAAHAVGWYQVPAQELFVVLPLILLIGALPITPSGLGIQEGAFFYFLQAIGATPDQALGVAVILRAKSYLLALCGGFLWLRVRKG